MKPITFLLFLLSLCSAEKEPKHLCSRGKSVERWISNSSTLSLNQSKIDISFYDISIDINFESNFIYGPNRPLLIWISSPSNNPRFLGNLNDEPDVANATLYVLNPTSTSSYTFLIQQADSKWTSGFSSFKGIGVLENTSAVGGINFFSEGTAGKTISATVRTYGLRVDS